MAKAKAEPKKAAPKGAAPSNGAAGKAKRPGASPEARNLAKAIGQFLLKDDQIGASYANAKDDHRDAFVARLAEMLDRREAERKRRAEKKAGG